MIDMPFSLLAFWHGGLLLLFSSAMPISVLHEFLFFEKNDEKIPIGKHTTQPRILHDSCSMLHA